MTATTYHHGDLPVALLEAVDEVVRAGGVAEVSLRAVARRAGVSHAAPAHHFGDKAGLLTAYAAQGFETLRHQLSAAGESARAAGEQELFAMGLAYISFAVEERGRFTVMFRPEAVHAEQAVYRTACDGAFQVLLNAVRRLRADLSPDDPELLHAATGAWSILHGFATLWLDGNLSPHITEGPPAEAAAAVLSGFGTTLMIALGAVPAAGAPAPAGAPPPARR